MTDALERILFSIQGEKMELKVKVEIEVEGKRKKDKNADVWMRLSVLF